jgi:hypothetical protein
MGAFFFLLGAGWRGIKQFKLSLKFHRNTKLNGKDKARLLCAIGLSFL